MTSVGDILELAYGKALKAADRDGGEYPVVGSSGIVGAHSKGLTGDPTIVVGRKGSIGSVTWIDGPAWPIDTAYFVRPVRNDLDLRWLYWLLRSLRMETMNKSAAVPGLNRDDVYRLAIAVPPLPEQRRIAAILDHADALRTQRRETLAHLDSLAISTFTEFFGAPSTWHDRWPKTTVGNLATSVDYGTSGKSGATGEWAILRMGNVTDDGRIDLSELKYIDLQPNEVAKYTVRAGDLLFNRTNSREKVGKSAVVRTGDPLALAGYLIRVRFKNPHVAEYVSAYLRSEHGKATRLRLAKAAVNQANINATEMRGIALPDPPDELIVRFADTLASVELRRSEALKSAEALDELFTSLQSRAFRGEL
ncbi:MAG: restriction endonuclease subunit S [Gordonia sp. (in: high G+C Gram-positive bacteria)]